MISESSQTPLLRYGSVVAAHRETDGMINARIKTGNAVMP